MRLRETISHQRTLCLVLVVLLLAPVATAARLVVPRLESSSPPPVLHAADIDGGLLASSARVTGDLAWEYEAGWFLADAAGAARGSLLATVEGVDVVAFQYDAPRDHVLGVLVDGVTQKWLPAGNDATFDIVLDGLKHTIAWSVVAEKGDSVGVHVAGTQPLGDVALLSIPASITVCTGDEVLTIRLGWARALAKDALEVRIDGQPVPIEDLQVKRGWNVVETSLAVPIPDPLTERSVVRVEVTARIGDEVQRIVDSLVDVVVRTSVLWNLPSGWEYDLTPDLGFLTACALNSIVDVSLTVDGEDRTTDMVPHVLGADYSWDHELAFMERHEYTLDVQLRYGPAFHFERNFTEGLDVLEMDANLGYLVFTTGAGAWTMSAPTNVAALPPVRTAAQPGAVFGWRFVTLQSDAHMRVVYAPLELWCDPLLGVCDPYGGHAPGFFPEGFIETSLTVTGRGTTTWYPTLGQFVAASHFSTLDTSRIEATAREAVDGLAP